MQHRTVNQTLLDTLLNNVPDLVFVKNSSGIYTECNEAFALFVGKPREAIIGKTDYDLFPFEIADFFRDHDQAILKKGTPRRNEEWVSYPNGSQVLLDTIKIPYNFDETAESGVLVLSRDITSLKQAEQQAQLSGQRYESVLENSKDGFWLINAQAEILEVNDAYCRYSGYPRAELLGLSIHDLDAQQTASTIQQHLQLLTSSTSEIFESTHRKKDGSLWPVEVSISYSALQGGCFFAFIRDITERKIQEEMSALRFTLSEMVFQDDLHQMLREALDTAERLTHSKMGFFHFVEEDEETVSTQAWSTRTLQEMCYAKGEGMHYPVSQAGVWVDCIHQKKPVIHNDYPSLKHKKGMPEGHPKLQRELTVPLFRNAKVVAIIGLGNKETEYTDADVQTVEQIANLCFEYSERKRAEQQIQFMAYNDVLTKLPNRQLFADRLSQALSRSKRSGETIGICYLDLDGFKPINDQYGHDTGDQLLIQFAMRLEAELREEDTLARIGGDEFALILNGLQDTPGAEDTVQRILQSIALAPFDIQGNRFHISASIGITCYPQDNSDTDTLLRNADQAMYQAKNNGKNTYHLHTLVQNQRQLERDKSLEEFQTALQEQQLILYYQPRVDLQNAQLAGVEALVRWQHPEKGLLLPGRFLPLIEDTPLAIALDEWVLEEALDQHLRWHQQGLTIPISVNITPSHIQQLSFPDYLSSLLQKYPNDIAEYLELEILETSAIADIATVSQVMDECTGLGVKFSLDDFGTGYSSLTYFHHLPIQILKIDQNFVRQMLKSSEDQKIVEGVIRLASSINRPVVAEGVENKALGYMLHQLGCNYAQGFGIARPMPPAALPHWLNDWNQDSFWQQISQKIPHPSESYDVNVAIFIVREWLKQVRKTLISHPKTNIPAYDEKLCHFTEWYHGIGVSKYGERPQFPFLLAKYDMMHKLARDLRSQSQNQALSETALQPLDQYAEELIELLHRLDIGRVTQGNNTPSSSDG